jgi:hypothetical protein
LRWPAALTLGVVLQWAPELLGSSEEAAFGLVAASYVALAAFALVNLRLVGMPIVVLGLALNGAVIAVNGGMPVRADAVTAAGLAESVESVKSLDFGSKRHLEGQDDRMAILGDVIPVRPLGEVLSFGDLVLSAGVGNLLFRLLKPSRRHRRAPNLRRDEAADGVVIDLRAQAELAGARQGAS